MKTEENTVKKQCPEFPYFGATYPDARCINGYLYDMDNCDEQGNVYTHAGECDPCPFCNTEEFLINQKADEQELEAVKVWMDNIQKRYGFTTPSTGDKETEK